LGKHAVNILVVEDEPLIAADIEMILLDLGHEVVGIADTKAAALSIIGEHELGMSFVDMKLRDGFTGVEIAGALRDASVPFYFLTGNPELVPAGGGGALGVLRKPFSEQQIEQALARLEQPAGNPGP
jgi:CheY-like chemotaxis protein